MASLAIYGHHNISVTDKACVWSSQKSDTDKVLKLNDLYPCKSHRSTERNALKDEINTLFQKLQVFDEGIGLTWLLQEESSTDKKLLVAIEDVVFCPEYIQATNKSKYFLE